MLRAFLLPTSLPLRRIAPGLKRITQVGFLTAALLATPALFAQSEEDDGVDPGLDLPEQFQTYGPSDPNVRKATAIVNGEVITGTDVDQRVALLMIGQDQKVPEAQMPRIRAQVLRDLIDETLEIQEARAKDIKVEPQDVDANYARIAQRFRQKPAKFAEYLASHGSSERTLKRQIAGEAAWNRLVGRQVEPFVNVSDEEVKSVITRLEATKGSYEYRVSEIFLPATPADIQQVAANARRMMEKMQSGEGSFAVYAHQFSQASTAAVGGDLGWVSAKQLPESLSQSAQEMEVGQMAGPIEVSGGLSILYLADKRQVLTDDPRDAIVSLRQVSIAFPPGSNRDANAQTAKVFSEATRSMGGCGRATEVAKRFNAEVVDNDNVRLRDITPAVQQMLVNLAIGEATPVFGSPSEGVQVLVLCGRDDPQTDSALNPDAIKGQIEQSRINQRAQRYLRDLRRDAVIEYR